MSLYTALCKQHRELEAQNDMVLSLLGEKSEELDAALQDLQDVKDLYRSQLDTALYQLTAQDASQQKE